MTAAEVRELVASALCGPIEVVPRGRSDFLLQTPLTFDDGDVVTVFLRRLHGGGDRWALTDRGHTLMHLDALGFDATAGRRGFLFEGILARHGVANAEGELATETSAEELPQALYDFIHCLLRVTDLSFLKRELVHSLFMEDFAGVVAEAGERCGWRADRSHVDPAVDPDRRYPVDVELARNGREVFAFGMQNDDRCRDATITILHFERHNRRVPTVGVFEDQTVIGRRVLARFSDVCNGPQFSSLGAARERLESYLRTIA